MERIGGQGYLGGLAWARLWAGLLPTRGMSYNHEDLGGREADEAEQMLWMVATIS